MEKVQYLTATSLQKLKDEHEKLKTETILEIASRINEAKQQGDLSENAEYHQAKEDMAWAQGRLLELEQIISTAQIIDENNKKTGGKIEIGNTVTVEINGKKKDFTIVGPQEADPLRGFISNESPLGEAFLGAVAKDKIEVETPSGKQTYKILEVK